MSLRVYNYLTRELEPFKPLEEGRVGMYVCGPTVYDHSHLGHAKLYVSMDVIVRYLRYLGYQVRHVRNITDVGHLLDSGEDRIMRGVRRERVEPMELVEIYSRSYFEDMDALGVLRPQISPRASCHIPEQIEIVRELLGKGYAYETPEGDVYFSVESFEGYGKLSGRKLEDLEHGARVAVRDAKRNPADFAVWKHAEPEHILRWPSPWGWGYPGWHIECSAMATKYLGQPFDIHGGGVENIFPHNESEIAQAEAARGVPFSNYWLLAGSLTVNGVQMSKSLGNFVRIKDALKQYSAESIRSFVLSAHYRSKIDFSHEALMAADSGVKRLHNVVRAVRARLNQAPADAAADPGVLADLEPHRAAFEAAMDDDFNTPQALAALHELTREVNRWLDGGRPLNHGALTAIDGLFRSLGGDVLGTIPDELASSAAEGEIVDGLIALLLDARQTYRAERNWARADAVRDQLAALGIVVEDRPEGPTWRLER